VLWYDSTIKTATVRDLRNHFSRLLAWIAAGEEITLTQRGKPVARLSPARTPAGLEKVDWNQSAAMARDRSREIRLSACESSELLMEAGGKW
jgi:prevent-host-death family protein